MDIFALSLFFAFIFCLCLFIRNRKERNRAVNALRATNEWGRILNEFWSSPLLDMAFRGSFEGVYDKSLNSREMKNLVDKVLCSYRKLVEFDPDSPYVRDEKILEVILVPITMLFDGGEQKAKCSKCNKLINLAVYDLHKHLCDKLEVSRLIRKINPR